MNRDELRSWGEALGCVWAMRKSADTWRQFSEDRRVKEILRSEPEMLSYIQMVLQKTLETLSTLEPEPLKE